jgi:tetratricopeptide (TPR) repeat protein
VRHILLKQSHAEVDASAVDRLMQQGNQAYQSGQLEAAVKFWQQAHTAMRNTRTVQARRIALANLVRYNVPWSVIGCDRGVRSLFASGLLMGQPQGEAQALGNLGIAYKELGNYDQHYNRTDKLAS